MDAVGRTRRAHAGGDHEHFAVRLLPYGMGCAIVASGGAVQQDCKIVIFRPMHRIKITVGPSRPASFLRSIKQISHSYAVAPRDDACDLVGRLSALTGPVAGIDLTAHPIRMNTRVASNARVCLMWTYGSSFARPCAPIRAIIRTPIRTPIRTLTPFKCRSDRRAAGCSRYRALPRARASTRGSPTG